MATADSEFDAAFVSLVTSLTEAKSSEASTTISSLEQQLDGPKGIVQYLLPRLWLSAAAAADDDDGSQSVQGDAALSILSHLVETRPSDYMSLTASAVRHDIEQHFVTRSTTSDDDADAPSNTHNISDALILALAKLLIGPNSDNQVGIASNASASLLALSRWDSSGSVSSVNHYHHKLSYRVLSTIDTLLYHLQDQSPEKQRESSPSQMRIANLMVDICLLGGDEMACALSSGIMDKLLHIALDFPNEDPLLQVSALDQLERLTTVHVRVHDNYNHHAQYPVSNERAEFLLANDVLRRGLLILVGCPGGDLTTDPIPGSDEEWLEADPINGGAALRLLTEICRVGVSSSESISDATRNKFQLLLSSFQKALHNFHPQGELERLSYIYAVSSLVGSCAMVVSSSSSSAGDVVNTVLDDHALLHEWLSLHSRVSQPKLKSTVLCSLSQVMEPSMWKDEFIGGTNNTAVARPTDSIVLQLYQTFGQANNERDSTELILASAKSPFVEERLGAYNILRALVMRGVGVRLLLLYNDGSDDGSGSTFLDWLLRHELESTSEGKKAKYQICHSMLSANDNMLGGLIPVRALCQLEEWKRTGPNFMATTTWEMATE